jgi:hypothetical protein
MNHTRRWKLSSAQRSDIWNRWKAGESLHEIGRALGKSHVVIQFLLARHGGIAPAARRRSRRVLTMAEREDISRRIASGNSMRVFRNGEPGRSGVVGGGAADHGANDLQILDLVFGHGEGIVGEHDEVGKLARGDRAFDGFLV